MRVGSAKSLGSRFLYLVFCAVLHVREGGAINVNVAERSPLALGNLQRRFSKFSYLVEDQRPCDFLSVEGFLLKGKMYWFEVFFC